jgi:hypothetical protein
LVNTILAPSGFVVPAGDLKDVDVELPPGFIGNPLATPRCPQYQIVKKSSTGCPASATVGLSQVSIKNFEGGNDFLTQGKGEPIYNDEPAYGYAAEFGFPYVTAQQVLVGSVRSDSDFGVTASAKNVPIFNWTYGAFTILEGNPAGAAGKAFLTNPTSCAEEGLNGPVTRIVTNTWQQPSVLDQKAVDNEPVTGCNLLHFSPQFTFQPSTSDAASVTAATAHLHIDQAGLLNPSELAPPHLKKSAVTLPAGLTLNAAAADGLQACSTAQMGLKTTSGAMPNPIRFDKSHPSCSDASKIGTVEIKTPLLEEPLEGTVYLAAQEDNPFHSLLALYLVVDDAKTGTVVKLPGEVKLDQSTGQMTVTFDNNPQLPVEDLTLNIRGGGPRSSLATPDVCAKYTANGEWTPWSAPESGPPARTTDSFNVASGVGGSACPTSKAARPFNLGFSAGSTDPTAGKHSTFVLNLTRPDGSQELGKVSVTTPPGFAATLKGVSICPWASVDAAAAKSKGAEEIASPSCPASSQVGTTTIGAGVGSQPLQVKTGHVYLTGSYKGAPASLTFIVPAVAGPFDLGVQVVKTALNVDPKTAQVTAVSDPIPQILKGVPLQIREVQVNLDRSGFALNPTNCEPMSITGQVTGGSGAVANLADRFQVGNCAALGFKPNVKLQLHGGTKRGAYQRVVATVTARAGDANIARAAVTFPHSSFLAQEHLDKVCTRVQYAAKACPPGSVYGYATAITPLLDEPIQGPVYLRSNPEHELPDLVAALRGADAQPIEVELQGRTDSKNGGIRNTFDLVPDAPVSKFTLQIKGGNHALLVNSRDLCKGKQRATVRLNAQNGKVRNFRTVVGNDCEKKESKGKARHSAAKRLAVAWWRSAF